MTVHVKICGLTTPEAVEAVQNADYAGFIFYAPSPRNLTPQQAATLAVELKPPAVAVTVDADDALLEEIAACLKPAHFELHGKESPARVREIKERFRLPVIKAIPVSSPKDMLLAHGYADSADMLLFDARPPKGMPGGNGVAFDWQILAGQEFSLPWFLSGGITLENVEEALRISGARKIDVSSSLESARGVKDPEKIRVFIEKVRGL